MKSKADKIIIKNQEKDSEEIICEDCLRKKTEREEKELERIQREVLDLEERIKSVELDTEIMEKKTGKDELEQMSRNKIEILKQISSFENEQENKTREINKLVEGVLKLEMEEEKFWSEINEYEQELFQLEERKSIYDKNIQNLEAEIARLNEINVLNDVFKITYLDEVGTMNGLKIGKLKSEGSVMSLGLQKIHVFPKVNWEETNAGLGHLVHFFAFLQEKFNGFKYRKVDSFEINGSFSKLRGKIGDLADTYEIYGPPGNEGRFSLAMQLLMSCVNDIFEFFRNSKEFNSDLQLKNSHLDLPHKINDFEIGEISIKLEPGDSKWDKWTSAAKYLLTDVKYLIYLISVYDKNLEEKENLF